MLKEIIRDKEIMKAVGLLGRLGLNIVISLLIFFFPALYIENRFPSGNLILLTGIILGIVSGIYINYNHLKRYYGKDRNQPPTL